MSWRNLKLRDVGQIVTGKTPPTSNNANYGGDVPFVTPSDMDGQRTIFSTGRTVSPQGIKTVGSSFVKSPAIVVSCIGSDMGKAALVNRSFLSNQQINSVIPSSDFDRLFVYYNLSMRKDEIRHKASGAAQPIMNKSDFGNLSLEVPDLPEQQAIAAVLSALDDKIELNRRMNETLEASARALFRDWFVDFGPTRAKMVGAPAYLPSEVWSFFPANVDDEGKPEGWENRQVESFAELKGGKQLDRSQIFEQGAVPVFGGAGLMGFTYDHNADGYVISVGRVGAYCGQFFAHRGKAWINNNASGIHVLDQQISEWFFLALKHLDMDVIKKGAAQPFVSNGDIATLPVMWPGNDIICEFSKILNPMVLKRESNERESRTLAEARDLLLPKLMSGEIRVAQAEKLVGDRL